MNEHRRPSALDLVEDGLEVRIAQILAVVVAQQPDAVELEHVQSVSDLGESSLDVGQRENGERAETRGMRPDDVARRLVDRARQIPNRRTAHERDAGRGDREQAAVDPARIHRFEVRVDGPARQWEAIDGFHAMGRQRAHVGLGQEVAPSPRPGRSLEWGMLSSLSCSDRYIIFESSFELLTSALRGAADHLEHRSDGSRKETTHGPDLSSPDA
jgi:hypothetical protein